MLSSLDPHSGYLNEDEFKDMQTQTKGEFGGLGIEVIMDGGLIKVVSPMDDTPAHAAGIKAGDFITHLDGVAVLGMTMDECLAKMRGKPGTKIRLTIRRKGEKPFDVTITRAVIKLRAVKWETFGNIGYIRVASFNETTDSEVRKAITAINKKLGDSTDGFILDLRNNPGGLLDQSIKVASMFLNEGEIVSIRHRDQTRIQRYNTTGSDLTNGLPLVVLINEGSASASEIVAGALKDHKRAVIVGVRSFGKGSVQSVIPVSDKAAIRLTVARYYTPSGVSIQAQGIEPDIEITPGKFESYGVVKGYAEANLYKALDNKKEPLTPDQERAVEEEVVDGKKTDGKSTDKDDYQLERAKEIVRAMAIFRINNNVVKK